MAWMIDNSSLAIILLCVIWALLSLGQAVYTKATGFDLTESVLIGTGCEGPTNIAVAREEDELPKCSSIERHVLAGGAAG